MTSELDDLENFEAYRQREVPKQFASHATIEALKFSEPIARHLLGKVPDMVRDSEEAVSRQYQRALPGREQRMSDSLLHDTQSSYPDMALTTQSWFPASKCQISDKAANQDLLESRHPSQLPGPSQTTTSIGLHSSLPMTSLDLEQTASCFCCGPCTCPSSLPGWISTKSPSSGDFSQILYIVQNMSNRIAILEQWHEGHAIHLDGHLSSSLFSQPSLMQNGLSSRTRHDCMGESAANQDNGLHLQSASSIFTRSSNEISATADISNESLDWESLINMDNSKD
jgi:hypothetical protein